MTPKQLSKRTTADALAEILDVDLENCDVDVCLASLIDHQGIPTFQRLNITRDLAVQFRALVEKLLDSWRGDNEKGDLVLRGFDPGAKLDGYEVEHLDLSNHDAIDKQIAALANDADLKLFAEDEDFITGLRFYVILLKPEGAKPIYLFRTYTPKRELTRSALFGVVLQKGQYDRYKDHLFLFDHGIDCFCRDGRMFVVNKGNFQKIFQFYELLIKTAKATLKVIQKHIPVENFDEFAQACEGHLLKLAKLKNIASKPYLKTVTIGDIRRVIGKYKLAIKLVGKGAKQKILFEPSDKWAILRLLDDDYLESAMTGANYEVNSKRPLGG